MKSFDEWFGEASQDKLFWESPSKASKMGFEAGQQSKQAEVDGLRKNFNNALKTIEIQQRFLDDADGANKVLTSQASELQKLIDKALSFVEDAHSENWQDCISCINNILKGDQS